MARDLASIALAVGDFVGSLNVAANLILAYVIWHLSEQLKKDTHDG